MRRGVLATLGWALLAGGCGYEDLMLRLGRQVHVPDNPPSLATPVQHDRIVQVTTPHVDVLWVIDDSCSMTEEQSALTTNFASFMEVFLDLGLQWHIGVVSTDMESPEASGKLRSAGGRRFLDRSVANPQGLFAQMATLGTGGSFDEMGRRAVFRALTEPLQSTDNAGFYRDEASLHVVVISDEDDSSGVSRRALGSSPSSPR